MSDTYTRVNWEDSPSTNTPISAENLNKMDKGIEDAHKKCTEISEQIDDKITSPTSAKVGQILSVVEVDENGKPTKWQPVDKPAGETGNAEGCIKVYNNVASMKADTNLKVGDVVETVGYYNIFDVGGGRYTVASSPTNNEILNIKLDNGLYAILGLENNTYYLSRLGLGYGQKSIAEVFPLISDNTITIINNGWGTAFTKDSSADAFAIQYIVNIFGIRGEIVLDGFDYYIDNTLKLKSLLTIRGLKKNTNIYGGNSSYSGSNLLVTKDIDCFNMVNNTLHLRLLDFNISSKVDNPTGAFLRTNNCSYMELNGLYINNFAYGVYKTNGYYWNKIENCRFNWINKNGIDLRMRTGESSQNYANESIIRDCIFNLGESLFHRDDIPDTEPTPDFGNCIVINGNGVVVDHCDVTSAKIGVYCDTYYNGINLENLYSEGIWISQVYVDSFRSDRVSYTNGFNMGTKISFKGYKGQYLLDYSKEIPHSEIAHYNHATHPLFIDLFKKGKPFKVKYRIAEANKTTGCGFTFGRVKKNAINDVHTIDNLADENMEHLTVAKGKTYGVTSRPVLVDSTNHIYTFTMTDEEKAEFISSFDKFKYNYLLGGDGLKTITAIVENEDGSLNLTFDTSVTCRTYYGQYTIVQTNYSQMAEQYHMWFSGNPAGSNKYWWSELKDGYYYITALIHPYDLIMQSYENENVLCVLSFSNANTELLSIEYADDFPCTRFAVGYEESTLINDNNNPQGHLIITKDLGDSYFTFNNTKFIITGGKAYTEDGFEAVNTIPTKPIPFARYYDITNKQKVVVGADGTTTVYS